jgi:tRNA modification GTPase
MPGMIKELKINKFIKNKTVVSVITPLGEGGIGKIVVSGPDALNVVNRVFEGKGISGLHQAASQKLYYGYIRDRGQRIDEVVLHVIKQEDSFTGEDIVEVNCHGGIRVVVRICECLQSSGAEGVAWDALLLQSFQNNTMDFIQKEALQELIEARTKLGVKILLDQYAGALSKALREGLQVIEGIKRSLCERPFSHKEFWDKADVLSVFSPLVNSLEYLLETAPLGIALTTPQVLVILGKPNVGKSTIINAILGEERILVHHEPGTTRDYVTEFISVHNVPFELIDTAGIRDSKDTLESMGIEMTLEQLQRADRVMAVFDNSRPFDEEDKVIVDTLRSWLATKSSDTLHQKATLYAIIPVVNKCDLPVKLDRGKIGSAIGHPLCSLSAQSRDGLEGLQKRLVEELDTTYKPMRPVVFNKRQHMLLAKAISLLGQEKKCLTGEDKSRTVQLIVELKDIFTTCLKGLNS